MHFDDTFSSKQQGNVAVSFAIAYYTQKKWVVSIPLNDSQDYDLLVEDTEGYIYKVQVKSTRYVDKTGKYVAELKSSGGTKGSVYKDVCNTSVDYLFIMTASGTFYEVPLIDLEPVKSMTLGSKYEGFKINIW